MTHSLAGYGPTPGSSLTTALSLSLILVRLLRLVLTWTRLGHVAMRDRPDTSVAFLFSQVQSESVTFRDVFPPCVVSANQAALSWQLCRLGTRLRGPERHALAPKPPPGSLPRAACWPGAALWPCVTARGPGHMGGTWRAGDQRQALLSPCGTPPAAVHNPPPTGSLISSPNAEPGALVRTRSQSSRNRWLRGIKQTLLEVLRAPASAPHFATASPAFLIQRGSQVSCRPSNEPQSSHLRGEDSKRRAEVARQQGRKRVPGRRRLAATGSAAGRQTLRLVPVSESLR